MAKGLSRIALGATLLAVATAGQAAQVIRTFTLDASDFRLIFTQGGTATAVDPISLDVRINFDNGRDYVDETSGLTVLNYTLGGPLTFEYRTDLDLLSFSGFNDQSSCSFGNRDSCWLILGATSMSPNLLQVFQEANNGDGSNLFFADSRSLSFVDGAAVPEPATWAMMILGFGFVGGAMRYARRSTSVRFATA